MKYAKDAKFFGISVVTALAHLIGSKKHKKRPCYYRSLHFFAMHRRRLSYQGFKHINSIILRLLIPPQMILQQLKTAANPYSIWVCGVFVLIFDLCEFARLFGNMYYSTPMRLDNSSNKNTNFSVCVNVIIDGSPSRIRIVRRISFGMTTRPRSSMRRTIPVAFIYLSSGFCTIYGFGIIICQAC